MKLLGIGEFDIDGVFRLDADGFAAYINVSLKAGFGGDIGLSFQAGATVELYIGGLPQKILTKADGTQVTVKAGFKLNISGSVTFLGFASASGSITITMQRACSRSSSTCDRARADQRRGDAAARRSTPTTPRASRCCSTSASTPTCSRSSRSRPRASCS